MGKQSGITKQISKRGLTIGEAAEYVGLSVSGFRNWIQRGGVSCKIRGTRRYDLKALNAALDSLSGFTKSEPAERLSPYDHWKTRRGR
jgi:hypothetical protein